MSVGWACKCGHFNEVASAKVGTHNILGVCEKSCGSSNIMVPFEEREVKTMTEWKLNDENRATADGSLTRAVQEVIDLDDDNRMDILADILGAEALAMGIEVAGMPDRVMGIAMLDGRPVMLGDCPCKGAHCRAAWGWTWSANDLNMTGHRGSMEVKPCKSFKATIFEPATGEMLYAAPYGMNPDEYYRFQRKEWGDVDKIGMANFMNANISTTEGKRQAADWQRDA
tara:strand:- start:7687 stop:8367 length:681 start_codon:yes stop_codon:yes gene_type:complete